MGVLLSHTQVRTQMVQARVPSGQGPDSFFQGVPAYTAFIPKVSSWSPVASPTLASRLPSSQQERGRGKTASPVKSPHHSLLHLIGQTCTWPHLTPREARKCSFSSGKPCTQLTTEKTIERTLGETPIPASPCLFLVAVRWNRWTLLEPRRKLMRREHREGRWHDVGTAEDGNKETERTRPLARF